MTQPTFERFDAHCHYIGDHADDVELLGELGLKVLNVCIPRPDPAWRGERRLYRGLADRHPERYAWCGGFDPPTAEDFRRPSAWAGKAVREVERDLAQGAVGIKVWKCIGMEVRTDQGRCVTIDHPIFEPVLAALEDAGATLLAHIGEPRACWRPLDEESPHAAYYRRRPEWHMADRDDVPSHEELIASLDRVLERHPRLKVVGAHLGSLEFDIAEVAARLERYPSFAVDTSSRLLDLALQDRAKVREVFHRHRDRILFGTDIVHLEPSSGLSPAARRERLAAAGARWRAELDFLTDGEPVTIRGRRVDGLGLGRELVDRMSIGNPRRWYPRL